MRNAERSSASYFLLPTSDFKTSVKVCNITYKRLCLYLFVHWRKFAKNRFAAKAPGHVV